MFHTIESPHKDGITNACVILYMPSHSKREVVGGMKMLLRAKFNEKAFVPDRDKF